MFFTKKDVSLLDNLRAQFEGAFDRDPWCFTTTMTIMAPKTDYTKERNDIIVIFKHGDLSSGGMLHSTVLCFPIQYSSLKARPLCKRDIPATRDSRVKSRGLLFSITRSFCIERAFVLQSFSQCLFKLFFALIFATLRINSDLTMVSYSEVNAVNVNQNSTSMAMLRCGNSGKLIHEYCNDEEFFCPADSITKSIFQKALPHKKVRQRKVRFEDQLVSNVWERPNTTPEEKNDLFYSRVELQAFRKAFREDRNSGYSICRQESTLFSSLGLTSGIKGLFHKTSTTMASLSQNKTLIISNANKKGNDPVKHPLSTQNIETQERKSLSPIKALQEPDTTVLIDTLYLF